MHVSVTKCPYLTSPPSPRPSNRHAYYKHAIYPSDSSSQHVHARHGAAAAGQARHTTSERPFLGSTAEGGMQPIQHIQSVHARPRARPSTRPRHQTAAADVHASHCMGRPATMAMAMAVSHDRPGRRLAGLIRRANGAAGNTCAALLRLRSMLLSRQYACATALALACRVPCLYR